MPHPGRRLAEFEGHRDLLIRQSLEMTHDQYLAVVVTELLQRCLEAVRELVADCRRRRSELLIREVMEQVDARPIAEGRRCERPLPIDAATLRDAVSTVRIDDTIESDTSQPEVKWHVRSVEIVTEPPVRLDQRLLYDVAGVDTTRHRTIEPHADQSVQGLPVTVQQTLYGGLFTSVRTDDQLTRVLPVRPHRARLTASR